MKRAQLLEAMRVMAAKGGSQNTHAQNAARRENGKKGGRPKKKAGKQ